MMGWPLSCIFLISGTQVLPQQDRESAEHEIECSQQKNATLVYRSWVALINLETSDRSGWKQRERQR